MLPMFPAKGMFSIMKTRHLMWKEKYPDKEKARAVAFTGIDNARPETKAIGNTLEQLREELPFDPLEFLEFNLPQHGHRRAGSVYPLR